MTQNLRSSIKGALNSSIKGGFHDLVFAGSTLDLDFAGAKSLKNQIGKEDVVSFTRASSGTYVDGDGLIKTSPVNLMVYSEELDQWNQFFGASVTPNAITAPDGTFTADLIDLTAAGNAQVVKSFTAEPSATYTVSFWAKSITATDTLRLYRDTASGGSVSIDITNEWQRYTNTYTTAASSPYDNVLFIYVPGTTNQYYVWGVQVEEGSTATDYIPTTSTISGAPRFDYDPTTGESLGLLIEEARTNLVPYSNLPSSWWSTTRLSDVSVSVDNPFNYSTVRRHRAQGVNAQHFFYRNDSTFLSANTDYTFSAFVAPEGTGADAGKIQLRIFLIGADSGSINFDLNTGQSNAHAGTSGTSANGSSWSISGYGMQLYANGWYRVWMTFQSSLTCSVGIVSINSLNAPDFHAYLGSNTGGYYVAGIQVEQGTFRTSPINTDGATVTRAADVAEITGNKFAKTNLLQYSERFDEWTLGTNTPVTPNAIAAPDGSTTADQIYMGTGGGSFLHQSVTLTQNQTYTYSVYAKAVTPGSNNQFHLYSNSVNPKHPSSAFVATSEWQRFNFTFTHTDPTASVEMYILNLGDTYTTNVYFWGVQLETGDELTEYTPSVESFVSRASSATYVDDTTGLIKTTPVNLLIRSEEFNSVAWAKIGLGTGSSPVVTVNQAAAPNGTQTATRLQCALNGGGGSAGNQSLIAQTYSSSGNQTISLYVKSNTGSNQTIYFANTQTSGDTITVTPEWQRFEFSFSSPYVLAVGLRGRTGGGIDDTADVLIWAAQAEQGTTASPYIKTTSTISGAARYENGELILEEARTNIIDRNTTNYNSIWSNSVPTGAYNNAGIAPDGTNTAFATTAYGVRGQKNYSMTADTNDYTFSIFIKSTGGQGVYKTYQTGFHTGDSDTGGNTAYDFATDTVGHGYSRKLYANGWVRIWKTYANTSKTLFLVSNGASTSLDMLFWGAQLEQGSYPSSLIITPAGADVTRAADVSTSALGVDSFYNQSEGTMFVEALNYAHPTTGKALVPLSFSDNSFTNLIQLGGSTGSNAFNFDTISSGTQSRTILGNYSSDKLKSAGAYKVADQAGSLDGASVVTSSPSSIASTINRLDIGNNHTGGLFINGHIKRLAYFPTRLPNANLQNIAS